MKLSSQDIQRHKNQGKTQRGAGWREGQANDPPAGSADGGPSDGATSALSEGAFDGQSDDQSKGQCDGHQNSFSWFVRGPVGSQSRGADSCVMESECKCRCQGSSEQGAVDGLPRDASSGQLQGELAC